METTFAADSSDVAQEIQRLELSTEIAEMVGADQALRFGAGVAKKKELIGRVFPPIRIFRSVWVK